MNTLSNREQLLKYGYWSGLNDGKYYDDCFMVELKPGIYKFKGILGAIRTSNTYKKKGQSAYLLGTGFNKYLDIIINNMSYFDAKKYVGIQGVCNIHCSIENIYICNSIYILQIRFMHIQVQCIDIHYLCIRYKHIHFRIFI